VTKGDLPIKMWWTFKGEDESFPYNLTTNDGIIITKSTQKVSMLNIDQVKARHRGNYTCFAHNKAGLSQQSSYLLINGSMENFQFFFNLERFQNFAICFLNFCFIFILN
jgi:hypothetical protein